MATLKRLAAILAMAAPALVPTAAYAGPPYMTDDTEPPEPGHFEVYGPILEIEGRGSDYAGAFAAEVNYGAAQNLQLTLEIPVEYAHDTSGTKWGRGDIVAAAKYRFYDDENSGWSLAAFPELSIPTGSNGMGGDKIGAFLPVWFQKDSGAWSTFGGGGYAINPGAGNRDYWSGSLAVTRALSEDFTVGAEINLRGSDTEDGRATTRLGIGAVQNIVGPLRILASAGPTFADGGGPVTYHAFLALGADF